MPVVCPLCFGAFPFPLFTPHTAGAGRFVVAYGLVVPAGGAVPKALQVLVHGPKHRLHLPQDSTAFGGAVVFPPTAQAGQAASLDLETVQGFQ